MGKILISSLKDITAKLTLVGILMAVFSGSSLAEVIQSPYAVGERLNFKIYFEFVLGGNASMYVQGIEEDGGRRTMHIVSEAKSTPTVDRMYKVRDKIESWRDLEMKASVKYSKRLREGKWKDDKVVEYNQEAGTALLYRKPGQPADTVKINPPVMDIISAFYYVRECSLEVGKSLFIPLHDIEKQYLLEVKVLRKETVEVPGGTFDCFVVEPQLQSSGLFRREGSLQIWLTDDRYKMPVLMQSKLYFGRVWAKLVDYTRGQE